MARLNISGFETGDASEFGSAAVTGTGTIQSSVKRTGTYAFRSNPTTTAVGFVIMRRANVNNPFAAATVYYRSYFYYTTAPASGDEVILRTTDGTNTKFELRLDSSGVLVGYDSALNATTGLTVLAPNTWYRIEVMAQSGAAADYEVKIDGVSELSVTGVNLLVANHAQLHIGKSINRNGNSVDFYYDDVAVDNAAYPDEGAIELLSATGDGTLQDFPTGSFTDVDELPPSTADYILTDAVASHAETETLTDVASTGITSSILSVKCHLYALRDGGSNGLIQAILYQGGNTTSGTSAATQVSAVGFGVISEVDPLSGSAYTTSDLDSLEAGVRELGAQASRIGWVGVMVEYIPSNTQTVILVGIGSDETFGTPALALMIYPPAIGSDEAFGTASVATDNQQEIQPSAIDSEEAFGTIILIQDQVIAPSGIDSAYVSGNATLFLPPRSAIQITIVGEVGQRVITMALGSWEIVDVDWTIEEGTVTIEVTGEDRFTEATRTVTTVVEFPNVTSVSYINLPNPVIYSIFPTSGNEGAPVIITGLHFTGVTKVSMGGLSMDFLINSDSSITAFVPDDATDSRIQVSHPTNGAVRSEDVFNVT